MDPVVTVSLCICMSLLFAVGSAHKLRAPAAFRSALMEYRLLPPSMSAVVAMILTVTELLAALLVLIPAVRAAGFAAMAGLLLLYTGAIGINLYRGRRDIDCGCSGPASRHELSGWLVLRNVLLFGLVVFAGVPPAVRSLNWLDLLLIAFTVLTASGLYLGMNQLLAQAPRMSRLRSGV